LPWAFVPSRPTQDLADPLGTALGAFELQKESPPWIRLFQYSSSHPWWLRWTHVAEVCSSCSQATQFGAWTAPRFDVRASSTLCLACGYVTVEHVRPDQTLRETAVEGKEWAPACVAVARLRRAIFSRTPMWPAQQHGYEGDDD
jgi:hypothetical protein